MSHRTTGLALLLLAASVTVSRTGVAQAGGAPAQPVANHAPSATTREADARTIRTLSQKWLAAQRAKNVDGVMAVYAPDADAFYGGQPLKGAVAIRANLVHDLAAYDKERPGYVPAWQTTSVDVAQAGDMAYESGTFDDSWNGGKSHERGHYLTVWRKFGDQWKVVRDFAAAEATAKPAPKPAP